MKQSGITKIILAVFTALLVFAPVLNRAAFAQTHQTYPDKIPKKPNGGGSGTNVIGPAIGLGIMVIREINRQKQIKKQQEQRVRPQRVVKPKRVKKPVKKVTKRSPQRSKNTSTPRKIVKKTPRLVLPPTLPPARSKPRVYSIDGKPWASDTEFVVVLNAGLTQAAVADFLTKYNLEVIEQTRIGLLGQVVLKLAYPEKMSPQQALLMATDERVAMAQPDYFYYPATEDDAEPAGMLEGLQYAFEKMGLTQLNGDESGEGVKLAVIDSGISADHPAIASGVSASFSAFPDAGADSLNLDHGTAVASIIAARAGMRGVAKDVSLMSAQVFKFNDKGHMVADSYDIVRGIDWAVANGAEILNLSFAGSKDRFLQTALKRAEEKGVITVAAAGNEGADAPVAYPAAYENVIAVTATDEDDGLYVFANRGEHVELAAPGVEVLVAAGEEGYGLQTGTSMATAYISGSIALMLEKEPEMSVQDIKDRLAKSALDLGPQGRDREFGHGRLDAYKALMTGAQAASAN